MKKSRSKDFQDEAEKGILLEDKSEPINNNNAGNSLIKAAKNKYSAEEDRSSEFFSYARECRIGDLIEILKDENITINLEQTEEDVNYTVLHYITFPSNDLIDNKEDCDSRKRCAEELLNYKNGKYNKFLIESQDIIYGNTPLHYACRYKRFELIDVLLITGANPLLKNDEEETPLSLLADDSSPTAIEKMRLMVNHCKSVLTNKDMQKPFITSLKNSNSINMLKFWIEEMNMDPDVAYYDIEIDNPLRLTCMAGRTDETAKCVQYIISKLQDVKTQINGVIGSYCISPLHLAAVTSNWRVLQVLIQNRYIDLKEIADPEGNVLHFIVLGLANGAAASQCLQLVIQRTRYWLQKEKHNFYFETKNKVGETAFELACKLGATNLVTQFINLDKMDSATNLITKEHLSTIYKFCPLALVPNLNGSITFVGELDERHKYNEINLHTEY